MAAPFCPGIELGLALLAALMVFLDDRLALLLAEAPPRLARWLLEHRDRARCRVQRTLFFSAIRVTVMLAVAPVPIALMLGGLS